MKRHLIAAASAVALLAGATAAKAEGELFLYNWSNYFPPELLTKFEEETGIAVTLDVYDSNETMLAKLQAGAGGYDVIVPSGYMVAILIEEGLAQRIDTLEMPNGAKVVAPHDAPFFDPERLYSAPYMWGTTGVTYDSARIEGELEESWKEVFEPRPELQGQIAMLNDEVEVYNAAAYYLGFNKCTESPEEAQAILDLLEAQKPRGDHAPSVERCIPPDLLRAFVRRLYLSEGRHHLLDRQLHDPGGRSQRREREDLRQLDAGAGERGRGLQLHRLHERHRGIVRLSRRCAQGQSGRQHVGGVRGQAASEYRLLGAGARAAQPGLDALEVLAGCLK